MSGLLPKLRPHIEIQNSKESRSSSEEKQEGGDAEIFPFKSTRLNIFKLVKIHVQLIF